MDKKMLFQIANSNDTARALFEYFRGRERNPKDGILDLRRTKYALRDEGVEVVPEEFLSNFKALERAGVGKLLMENGKPVQFIWKVNMKEAVSIAMGETAEAPKAANRVLKREASSGNNDENTKDIVVMLGRGRKAYLSLPASLTQDEAEFIYEALQDKML